MLYLRPEVWPQEFLVAEGVSHVFLETIGKRGEQPYGNGILVLLCITRYVARL